ncbi:membrane dipeptidase [Paludicola sp. MB14-C6]|uniref:dipeptidase n=1 Tax=Paludihabitans sp. MB14-C6 TaxID=3070656 RepID=UPI0027DEA9E2|nr:membrane dipeptidase [Paludicola sp. MB14-C6]WMJ23941.1 membrane dipeptidase [Paludicola sp. MB14-C6]
MHIFDLHCDTITECLRLNKSLNDNDLHLDLKRGNQYERWIQTFAFWINDCYRGEEAFHQFMLQRNLLMNELEAYPNEFERYQIGKEPTPHKCNVIMAVEGGHVLGGDLHKIEQLSKLGVSYLTLTWNDDNEIGCGAKGSNTGLTAFGKDVVRELERCNIVVDISHLNEAGFWDVCEIATKPIIATHSNARAIHDNKRNLYDDQLTYIIQHNGICGINFFPEFINGTKDATLDDIKRHVDHILSLGGENILAIGSDFDGALMPKILSGVQTLYILYENMVKWYGEKIAEKIFYKNAKYFIDNGISVN